MTGKTTLWLALAAALLAAPGLRPGRAHAQAEAYLEIRKNEHFAIPVVVEEFSRAGAVDGRSPEGLTLEGVLTRDLLYSDVVTVVRLAAGEPLPAGLLLDVRGMPVDRRVQARVRATLRPHGAGCEIAAHLLDETTGQEIFGRDYALEAAAGGLCDTWGVHRLADDIVYYLTGTAGCAATRIVFVRAGAAGKELHLIDWDGQREEALTALGSLVISPAWHPQATRVACTSYHSGMPVLIGIDLPGAGTTVLCADRTPTAPAYSPDGRHIAYAASREGNAELYVARADGSRPQRLTVHPAIDTAPSWSPSGKRIVFTSDRCGKPQLFVIDADGGNLEQLTFVGDWNDSPDWSPRSDRIVHVCLYDKGFDLALVDAGGGGWQRLTVGGGCENPRWAPDGQHVVFARSRGGARSLWILGVAAGSLRQLTATRGDSYNAAWSRPCERRPQVSEQGG